MGHLKISCGSFNYFKSDLVFFQCKTLLKSVHTLETTEDKIVIGNINNYKALHLHRTFHSKTLRDLSKGKESFVLFVFICLLLFSRRKQHWDGMECSRLLICLKQSLL